MIGIREHLFLGNRPVVVPGGVGRVLHLGSDTGSGIRCAEYFSVHYGSHSAPAADVEETLSFKNKLCLAFPAE